MSEFNEISCIAETRKHQLRVAELLLKCAQNLISRAMQHDKSKLESLEFDVFVKYTPRLKGMSYSTDPDSEYQKCLREMRPALAWHYQSNDHHPEHFGDVGISGMNLMQLLEMICDWKAATERHSDGDIMRSIDQNKVRFKIDPQLEAILIKTAEKITGL